MNGRRESNRPRPERQTTINRREGTRSRYQRCPKCKKLRLKMMPANYEWATRPRKHWAPLTPGGPKVCYLCIERSKSDAS